MNIADMHNVFRTLGQQMGMQLNRGILPESIDIYLNEAIIEKVQVDLLRGVHTALQEGVDLQPSTMATVNTFRTLYKKDAWQRDSSCAELPLINIPPGCLYEAKFNAAILPSCSDVY